MRRAEAAAAISVYPRACLAAAAQSLPQGCRLALARTGKNWRVAVLGPDSAAASRALACLLQDALARARRASRLRHREVFASAQAARLLQAGFPGMSADPLEQLEPQVRADRLEEIGRLLRRAQEDG